MGNKLLYLITFLLLIAAAAGGISYFVTLNRSVPVTNEPLDSQKIQKPRERLPTKGGQQMKLEF